ncbi:peptide chain release factor N(5)-glutamine methyltransferase [Paenibacillus sp. NEAU-GSW1]|uniref:peptide chain release factor N(5)-glutamine methyltransferase n=1 Tax=Paenibacillus sp. NEAU-GSW1 TaxID=2682486 RepID=UPI0012E11A97|nr:peptide chain release factor N(5)-glutamine methyltransferase [Paenibacillus sp. NEAU-GSW1]MUT65104.1 peptide chain release factor N(5)-glutamine methyltransferase [Paenibacillus sp. NEAU-GSW1]
MSEKAADRPFYEPAYTIREACLQASSFLAEQGVEEARPNAERLLLHVLGIERSALLRDWAERFPSEKAEAWMDAVRRKAAGEPVQYIIGEQWFYGRPFAVTPAVLIPRPETELLVEAVLEAADALWPPEGAAAPTVLDVGTGSGAIAVTLAAQRPGWRVNASDLSPDALAVARANAVRHEAADRISFVQGDLLAPFAVGAEGASAGLAADVLVSNPPYIPADDLAGLQREVRDFEPRLALDGGADGLDPYRRMAEQLPLLRQTPRIVGFELGMGQARDVAALLEAFGAWDEVRIINDYAGIERHVLAIKHTN